jgi:hypothetical protein
MSASVRGTRLSWRRSGKEDGHREYTVSYLVETTDSEDGPQTALAAPGLPYPGAIWVQGNDCDPWAFCQPNPSADPWQEKEGDPHRYWKCTFIFSTKSQRRCQDIPIEDPLLEPMKISGSFTKEKWEPAFDRSGSPIRSTSMEKLRGAEFDASRATVKIEQNVAYLNLELFAPMIDTVNNAPLWGLPTRCVKLDNVVWERKVYGSCGFFYTRTFEFSAGTFTNELGAVMSIHDRRLLDEGSRVLSGQWVKVGDCLSPVWDLTSICGTAPDPTNPMHYIAYKDRSGENTTTPLSASNPGAPADGESDVNKITVEYYPESNFLALGIPTTL